MIVAAITKVKNAKHKKSRNKITVRDVAILIAAYNEERVINATISAAKRLVKPHQIYVISDSSTDKTVRIASSRGVNVLALRINRGKAGALVAGIKRYRLLYHYKVVLLLDADTQLSRHYLRTGLPLFNDRGVSAVAGHAMTINDKGSPTFTGRYLLSYRQRLYAIYQYFMKYGQAAKWANAVTIVPGFASMYRTEALKHINIAAPGIVIEDYNMTFELHAKELGRIAFHPRAAVAYTQDPDTFADYVNQCIRWSLGFWQAVYRHRAHPSMFWVTLLAFIVEVLISSVLLCVSILLATTVILNDISGFRLSAISALVNPYYLIIGIFVQDYLLSVLAAVILRSPRYLILGLVFIPLRLVDAAICLWSFYRALFIKSNGRWKSPIRRVNQPLAKVRQRVV